MMGFAAVFEIPTSLFGDNVGWSKAVLIGLSLKTFSFINLIFCFYFAYLENVFFMWFTLIVEAILDAIGSSFMSGTYESVYLKWCKQENESKNPIFTSALKSNFGIKFIIPFDFIINAFG